MSTINKIAAWLSKLTGVRGDYILHFGVCFLLSLFGSHGVAAAIGASLAAEYKDSITPGNKWCWSDLLADLLGIAFGTFLRESIKNYL